MLETRGKKTQLRKHGEGVFSGLGGRRRHTLQNALTLQARVLTLEGGSNTFDIDDTFSKV